MMYDALRFPLKFVETIEYIHYKHCTKVNKHSIIWWKALTKKYVRQTHLTLYGASKNTVRSTAGTIHACCGNLPICSSLVKVEC